jgi:antitoxin CptB
MVSTEVPPKLRWACRRGMLELDVLLGNYLEEVFITLSEQDQNTFVDLLAENDQDLFTWLTGHIVPPSQKLAQMVEKIRHHAQNRH